MDNIRKLLEINTEIEGLLRVAEIRKTEVVESLLLSKTEEFAYLLKSSISMKNLEKPSCSTNVPVSQTVGESNNTSPTVISDTRPEPHDKIVPQPDELSEETETVLEMEVESGEKPVHDSNSNVTPPNFNNSVAFTPVMINNVNTKSMDDVTMSSTVNSEGVHVMRVDEMIHRQSSRDLKKAFSLNDRFRYIREIFDNNASYFDETINNIEMLSNLDEVYDYLLSDIGLNHEDETVKEFLAIIYNHFNA